MAGQLLPLICRKGKRKRTARDDLKEEAESLARKKERRIRRGKGESVSDLDTRARAIADNLGKDAKIRKQV
eukprot:3874973-Rhodomonas_salina.1